MAKAELSFVRDDENRHVYHIATRLDFDTWPKSGQTDTAVLCEKWSKTEWLDAKTSSRAVEVRTRDFPPGSHLLEVVPEDCRPCAACWRIFVVRCILWDMARAKNPKLVERALYCYRALYWTAAELAQYEEYGTRMPKSDADK